MEEIIGEGIIPDDDRLSEFLVIFYNMCKLISLTGK